MSGCDTLRRTHSGDLRGLGVSVGTSPPSVRPRPSSPRRQGTLTHSPCAHVCETLDDTLQQGSRLSWHSSCECQCTPPNSGTIHKNDVFLISSFFGISITTKDRYQFPQDPLWTKPSRTKRTRVSSTVRLGRLPWDSVPTCSSTPPPQNSGDSTGPTVHPPLGTGPCRDSGYVPTGRGGSHGTSVLKRIVLP